MDANICHPCFELLNSNITDVRLFGHLMVCITCGRSVRSVQHHPVERNNPIMNNLPMSHPAFHQVSYFKHNKALIGSVTNLNYQFMNEEKRLVRRLVTSLLLAT